jgi:hypothetical protein
MSLSIRLCFLSGSLLINQLITKSGDGVSYWLLIAPLDAKSSQLFYNDYKKWVGLEYYWGTIA